jgi:hypothetical protein
VGSGEPIAAVSSFPSYAAVDFARFSKAAQTVVPQTFTKTTENPQLPPHVVIMSGKWGGV